MRKFQSQNFKPQLPDKAVIPFDPLLVGLLAPVLEAFAFRFKRFDVFTTLRLDFSATLSGIELVVVCEYKLVLPLLEPPLLLLERPLLAPNVCIVSAEMRFFFFSSLLHISWQSWSSGNL